MWAIWKFSIGYRNLVLDIEKAHQENIIQNLVKRKGGGFKKYNSG